MYKYIILEVGTYINVKIKFVGISFNFQLYFSILFWYSKCLLSIFFYTSQHTQNNYKWKSNCLFKFNQ